MRAAPRRSSRTFCPALHGNDQSPLGRTHTLRARLRIGQALHSFQAVEGVARQVTLQLMAVAVVAAAGIALSFPATTVFAQTGSGAGGSPGVNDAGSGGDAGDSPELALPLPAGRRMWSANLTPPGTDSDWYRMSPASAFCASVDATTNAPGQVTLASSPTRDAAVSVGADPHRLTRLVLAAPAGHEAFFGLEPPMLMMLAGSESSTNPSPGRYTFSMGTSSHADLDPEADGESPEAGATLATATPLPMGCSAGALSGASDTADQYYFDVTDPRVLTVSFAIVSGGATEARVISPRGATYGTIQSGDALNVWASEAGRWSIVVAPASSAHAASTLPFAALAPFFAEQAALEDADYLLGVSDGPDPQPCRPSCMG